MQPQTRYARAGDVRIAYQVVGDGPLDLVLVPWFVTHLEHDWEDPALATFFRRLASFSRLILFDKRGCGLSDRIGPGDSAPTLEERMEDVTAVMDAVGSERAAVLGMSEGGPLSILFAATHPERVSSLVLYGTFARISPAADYAIGVDPFVMEDLYGGIEEAWGEGAALFWMAPTMDDERFVRWWTKLERLSMTPSGALATMRLNERIDVRDILPQVQAPTLVIHRAEDVIDPAHGRYIAERIPGARFSLLSTGGHVPSAGDIEELADEIEGFLTGVRPSHRDLDRVLATVLFTDIVRSTERAAELGDRRWRELLAEHDRLLTSEIERHRGRAIKSLGDGFLATFDGPGRGIRCARSVVSGARELGLDLRAGLHTGECELADGDVAGIAVHIGARVGATAEPGEVLVSNTVKDLVVGSGFEFADRGAHALKGVPGEWRLFAVTGGG